MTGRVAVWAATQDQATALAAVLGIDPSKVVPVGNRTRVVGLVLDGVLVLPGAAKGETGDLIEEELQPTVATCDRGAWLDLRDVPHDVDVADLLHSWLTERGFIQNAPPTVPLADFVPTWELEHIAVGRLIGGEWEQDDLPTRKHADRLARLLTAHRAGIPILVAPTRAWANELAAAAGLRRGEWLRLDLEREPLPDGDLVVITEPGRDLPDELQARTVHRVEVAAP